MIIASVSSSEPWHELQPHSQHPAWPAHSWIEPTEFWRSHLAVSIIAFPIILQTTSPIPIGRTPGHLSRGIRQAVYAIRLDGSTWVVQILRAPAARAEQRSLDFMPKAVQNHLGKGHWVATYF